MSYEEVTASEARDRLWPWVQSMQTFLARAIDASEGLEFDIEKPLFASESWAVGRVGAHVEPRQTPGGDWVPWQVDLGRDGKRGAKHFARAASNHPLVELARAVSPREFFIEFVPASVVEITLTMFANSAVSLPDWLNDWGTNRQWTPDEARRYLESGHAEDIAAFLAAGTPFDIERSDPRTCIPMSRE